MSSPKEILTSVLIGGTLLAGVAYPALIVPAIFLAKLDKNKKRKLQKSLHYLKRNKLISLKNKNDSTVIALTKDGQKLAQKYQAIKYVKSHARPKTWDKTWRIVIFDIPTERRVTRNAFRHMIKRIGMTNLQKSVWLYPFDCSEEIKFLKDFFSLKDQELRIILATNIGDDARFRKIFKI